MGKLVVSATGGAFPFFAPFVGWLGVFLTGSATTSNALFAKMQEVAEIYLHIAPLTTISTNSCGGAFGKMIFPVTGLQGEEADIFRFTLKHSIILSTIVGLITALQVYF